MSLTTDGDPNRNVTNTDRSGKELDHVVDKMHLRKKTENR